jgi:hypothetical protein
MYIHKLFQGKEAVQIVLIPSCSAVISLEVLFVSGLLRVVSILAETFYNTFVQKKL